MNTPPSHSFVRYPVFGAAHAGALKSVVLVSAALLGTPAAALAASPKLPTAAAPRATSTVPTVQVQFRDGTSVSAASGGQLQFGDGAAQARVNSALAGLPTDVRPIFERSPATLDRERATLEQQGKNPADLTVWFEFEVGSTAAAKELAARLSSDPLVVRAYTVDPTPPPPPTAGTAPSYAAFQAPMFQSLGIDTAQSVPGVLGTDIRVADVEYTIDLSHQEFSGQNARVINPVDSSGFTDASHGTGTGSVIVGQRDGHGIDGIAPSSEFLFQSEIGNRAGAIDQASAALRPGDVMVLEMQDGLPGGPDGAYTPAEINPAVRTAVTNAVKKGVIVTAAAGNGNANLDAPEYVAAMGVDSGSIIVGANGSDFCSSTRSPLISDFAPTRVYFSTYGSRVSVSAPGQCVPSATIGGDVAPNGPGTADDYSYFNGTSSATAVTGGVLTALSGAFKAKYGVALEPLMARHMLKKTGRAQQQVNGTPIGPQINLRAAIDGLTALPDTQLTSGPAALSTISDPRPTFGFSASRTGVSYECRFVPTTGAVTPAFGNCGTAGTYRPATDLADGTYEFQVRATTGANEYDPTPAKRTFTVAKPATVAVASGVLTLNATSVRRNFAVSVQGSAYRATDTQGIVAGSGCSQVSTTEVQCPTAGVTSISATGSPDNDVLKVDASVSVPTRLDGGNGNDTLTGASGAFSGSGGNGDDVVTGGPVADTLIGGEGADVLSGGGGGDLLGGNGGNDRYVLGGGDDSVYDSGPVADVDVLDLSAVASGVTVARTAASSMSVSATGQTGTVTRIDSIIGSAFADTITTGDTGFTVSAGNGNDVVTGGPVADTLIGGEGADVLSGGGGGDLLGGNGGNDRYVLGGGDDSVYDSGPVADVDVLDLSAVASGVTVARTAASSMSVSATGQTGTVTRIDSIIGSAFADTITTGDTGFTVSAGNGNDVVTGGPGADTLIGGAGLDVVEGKAGDDTINSKDGVGETVNCGDGTDSAVVDAADQRTACEAVSF